MPKRSNHQLYHGICSELRAPILFALIRSAPVSTTVALVADERRSQELVSEIEVYNQWFSGPTIEVIQCPEILPPEMDTQQGSERICNRLSFMNTLLGPAETKRLLVLTPEALLGSFPLKDSFEEHRLQLTVGQSISFSNLIQTLTGPFDYDSEALCEQPGQIAIRGGLIDIYPCQAGEPYRVDFFGDEIESIRSFDPGSQRTNESVSGIYITAFESAPSLQSNDGALIDYLPEEPIQWCFEDADRLRSKHPYRFEKIHDTKGAITSFYQMSNRRKQADRMICICEIDTEPSLFKDAERIKIDSEPTANYYHGLLENNYLKSKETERFKWETQLAEWAKVDYHIAFATATESEARRIRKRLDENPGTRKLEPQFYRNTISGGFIFRTAEQSNESKSTTDALKTLTAKGMFPLPLGKSGTILIADAEYWGSSKYKSHRPNKPPRPTPSQIDQLLDFSELVDGDPVVHLQQGICLFRGLSHLVIQGRTKEVISVEFAKSVILHVPLQESHLLTRYVGLTRTPPKLSTIGGVGWGKVRTAAERATLDYAAEMLQMQARRRKASGHAFPKDHVWMKDFEASFPFQETFDQLQAIHATKQDMERPDVMDRLICGDVGFGKTEIAIRAALKAVLAGKQVAVLVPTTILCRQHFNTFSERMAQYPVIIGMVSRFRSRKQNQESIARLAAGKIDILIGTHRLLSPDVHFQDLGLLIIDEEQRFGVKQKERIKQLRVDVDILTLSATPIPRTLHLAMSGARAMSVIETPPSDRRPIQTIVKSYDESLIKNAIQLEIDRGGQVFYLHNQVNTIQSVAQKIETMHPDLKIEVGHGQMPEGVLEKVMTRFVAGQVDVLVCSTIIESGIDIPNCNTLIIEGADRFGLAQLHQIRGRVGRSEKQAYAYLLLHRHAALLRSAQKRLSALSKHNRPGAGFRIAMRDLELRGAGNLLGTQQSGHIQGVGFDLYCQLLKQSVARLKGEPGAERIRAEVKLDFIATGAGGGRSRHTGHNSSFVAVKKTEYTDKTTHLIESALPSGYIPESGLRIDFYRRFAQAQRPEEIEQLADALSDRFGKHPEAVKVLIAVSRIRVFAETAAIRRVETKGNRLICQLARNSNPDKFLKFGTRFPRLKAKDPFKRLDEIESFLKRQSK